MIKKKKAVPEISQDIQDFLAPTNVKARRRFLLEKSAKNPVY